MKNKSFKLVSTLTDISLKLVWLCIYLIAISAFFLVSFDLGSKFGRNGAISEVEDYLQEIADKSNSAATIVKGDTKIIYVTPAPSTPAPKAKEWGGPELWTAVNNRRVELGVNALSTKEELCTIASIRLNQLLELGKLDGHEGFGNLPESRPDIKWIFEKYNISEFLVSGATSATEAVSLWENTLGHKKLLSGGEYVWGCIYAQNGFGVAIAAY